MLDLNLFSEIHSNIFSRLNYIIFVLLIFLGLYGVFSTKNLMKKLISLGIFQASIILFFISMAKIANGVMPVYKCLEWNVCPELYANPLPHVLMLTAIVVSIANLAVGLALVIRIKEEFNSINIEDE